MKKIVQQTDLKGLIEILYNDGTREIKFEPLPHQRKLLRASDKIVYFRAGRGSGKSFVAAELAVRELLHERRVICLAQTSQAIREVMAPEIQRMLSIIVPGEFTYNRASNKFVFGSGTIYLGSYEAIEAIRGYTSISLAILDEAALAPPDIFTVLSFCQRDCPVSPKIRMMSTPRSANWLSRFIADRKIPVITAKTSDNDKISEEEIELMKSTCPDENTWRREFYGEEVDDDDGGVIFTSSLLTDISKIHVGEENDGYCIGIDCSGLGTDSNIIVVRSEDQILEIIDKKVATAAEMASIVRGIILSRGSDKLSHIAIDEGYGLDLYNRLAEDELPCHLVAFGGSPENHAYANERAELYFNLKKGIEEHGLRGITEEIKRELQATKYKLNSSNRIQIIPKDEIKLNLGRSPDFADALALTYYAPIIPIEAFTTNRRLQSRLMAD